MKSSKSGNSDIICKDRVYPYTEKKNKAQLKTIIILLKVFIFLVFPAESVAIEERISENEKKTEECMSMFMFLGKMFPSNLYLAEKRNPKNIFLQKKVKTEDSGIFLDRQEQYSKTQEPDIPYTENYRKWKRELKYYSIINYLIYLYLLVFILITWKYHKKDFSIFHP